jgi:hypothetical protein
MNTSSRVGSKSQIAAAFVAELERLGRLPLARQGEIVSALIREFAQDPPGPPSIGRGASRPDP